VIDACPLETTIHTRGRKKRKGVKGKKPSRALCPSGIRGYECALGEATHIEIAETAEENIFSGFSFAPFVFLCG
jgi:hypothetical protein